MKQKQLSIFNRLEREYQNLKMEILNKSKDEIYNSFNQIFFYENMYEFLLNSDEETIELLEKTTLAKLYKYYLSVENIDWSNEEEIINFLKK